MEIFTNPPGKPLARRPKLSGKKEGFCPRVSLVP